MYPPAETVIATVDGPAGNKMISRCLFVGIVCGLLMPFPVRSLASTPGVSQNENPAPSNIPQLIRNVTWNELHASEHPAHFYRYIDKNISSDGSTTMEEIATREGTVGRLLEVNGQPANVQQLRQNDLSLSKLAADKDLQQAQLKDEHSDRDRRNNVIRDLPYAFIYRFIERDPEGLVHLKFRPNPEFHPGSRQGRMLQGMAGDFWIDPSSQRLVEVSGMLIKDATIGWGFLARLNRGGRFLLEQAKGPDGTWHQTILFVHFDGKILLLKGLHIHMKDIRCCFQPIPAGLTISEAVQMAEQSPPPENWQSELEAADKSGKRTKVHLLPTRSHR